MSKFWGDVTELPSYSTDEMLKGYSPDAMMFQALQKYAPDAISSINKQTPETAASQLASEKAVAPGYSELAQGLVSDADKYQRQLDPEFYAARAQVGKALEKYLGSYDPTSLTPTEEAQIARGIGATGGNLMPSQMNTIRNAQTFGSAGTQRWKNFGEAVTNAAQASQGLKSGLQGFQIGNNGARNAANNALNANFGFSTSALGDIAGNTQARIQKAKDPWDKIKAGSPSSVLGGIL